jgi:hypothetical protein
MHPHKSIFKFPTAQYCSFAYLEAGERAVLVEALEVKVLALLFGY